MSQVVSLQIGLPIDHRYGDDADGNERIWRSSIFKTPVSGAVHLGTEDFVGNAQADLKNHGGADKAALLYAAKHYPYWRRVLPQHDWIHGGFGENLTVSDMHEDNVAIGDIYTIGSTRVQVSQPRFPCWKLARRWGQKDLAARVQENRFGGWYIRVLQEGMIEAGQQIELVERPYPEWTVSRVFDLIYNLDRDHEESLALAECPAYANTEARAWIMRKIGKHQ